MGGVWERIIRSVRKILRTLLREHLVSGEALRTLMAEVESVLNSRPLTPNSESPADPEALTPNHLLLLRPNLNVSPGVFVKGDLYCQRRWKQVQYLTDVFWRRWLSGYLPSLQERQKWLKPRRNFAVGDLVFIGLWAASSKFTQEEMDSLDQSRSQQSLLPSQDQLRNYASLSSREENK